MTDQPITAAALRELGEKLNEAHAKTTPGEWGKSRLDMDSFTFCPETEQDDVVAYVYREPEPRIPVFGVNYRNDTAFIQLAHNSNPGASLLAAADRIEAQAREIERLRDRLRAIEEGAKHEEGEYQYRDNCG